MRKIYKTLMSLIMVMALLSGCGAVQAIKASSPSDTVAEFFDALKIQDVETAAGLYAGDVNTLKIENIEEFINSAFDKTTKKEIEKKLLEFTYVVESETITEPGAGEEGVEGTEAADKSKALDAEQDKSLKAKSKDSDGEKFEAKSKDSDGEKLEEDKGVVLPETAVVEVTVTTINFGQVVNDSLKKYFEEMAVTAQPGGTVENSLYSLEMLTRDSVGTAPSDYEAKFTVNLTKHDKTWKIDPVDLSSPLFNAYYGNIEGTVPQETTQVL